MKARDLMTKNPKCCNPNASVRDAIEIMRAEDCGLVPVTEGNGEGRVVGVVTDRDIALRLGESDVKPSSVRVRDVMSTRRILVCDNDRLLGVISTADLAREASAKETGRVIERISAPGPGPSH